MAVTICLFLLLFLVSCSAKEYDMDLLMPKVSPQKHDTYYCHSIQMSEEPRYITGFVPHAKKETAHHMLLFGCKEPGSDKDLWDCGEMGHHGDEAPIEHFPECKRGLKILYAWAMDAPNLDLPDDVGFKVGGDSGINYLVLQVHYGIVDKFVNNPELKDESGVTLHMTSHKQHKLAGVYELAAFGRIPEGETVYQEAACLYEHSTVMHPFAYRTHTHRLGKVVSAYRLRANEDGDFEWTEIGRRNPQLPQMFAPIKKDVSIEPGDIMASRCTMVNNSDKDVRTGPTMEDEMCNFYIMFYIDNGEVLRYGECDNLVSWEEDLHVPDNINQQASTVPEDQYDELMNM